MGVKLSDFKTDENREREGVWMDAGRGLRLLIGRLTNENYTSYVEALCKPLRAGLRHGGELATEQLKDVTRRAMARHILLGWENLTEDDGAEIPYDHETALKALHIPDFYRLVEAFANDRAQFMKAHDEESAGNLESPSAGT